MNIAPSTASATPLPAASPGARPDGPTTGHIVPAPQDSVDVAAPDTASATPAFGLILSRHLGDAKGLTSDQGVEDTTDAATGAAWTDAVTTVADAASDAIEVAQQVRPTFTAAAVSRGASPPDTQASGTPSGLPSGLSSGLTTSMTTSMTTNTPDSVSRKGRLAEDGTSDGPAVSDLAAQLALASQWTQAAKPANPIAAASSVPVDTPTAAVPTTGAARDGSNVGSPIGKDRATPRKDDKTRALDPAPGAPAMPAPYAPVDTAVAAVAAAAASGAAPAGFDIRSPLGLNQAPSGKDDATPRAATPSIDGGTVAASAATSGDAAHANARHGDDRGTPADTAAIVATKHSAASDVDAKTRSDRALAALDAASGPGAGAATRIDIASTGEAFAQRLAAHAASGVVGAGSTIATPVATTSPVIALIQEPVGSPAWSREVGQATLRMAANDLQSASIRLDPEHLGPLEVQVRVDNGVAHVAFNATHVDTRQALEASRGTLDQLFSNQGLKMGDVSVGSGASGGSGAATSDASANASRRDGGGSRWSGDDAGNDDAPATTVTTRIARALGLVDTFA